MFKRLGVRWRALTRAFSRNEWLTRLLHLPTSHGTAVERGLVLIQIDGLSRRQLNRALRRRQMPFVRRLLKREQYRALTMFSGLPSTTPSVQAELMYGVRTAVPAFSFRDHQTGRLVRMYEPGPAARKQAELAQQGAGLLEGGSAYCDIYSGGAAESHFCASTVGWGQIARAMNPLVLAGLLLWNGWSILRAMGMALVELYFALRDFLRGIFRRQNLWKELRMVPARVAVSVGMRELATIGASMDVTRGLPIVQLNFLGYDEQAHRRGPSSAYAHWSLRGIDQCIRRIWFAALRSPRRNYDVWLYSDHGQETSLPYSDASGLEIETAVSKVLGEPVTAAIDDASSRLKDRAQWLGGGKLQRVITGKPGPADPETHELAVAAMGPLGHAYLSAPLSPPERDEKARRLVQEAHIPLVLTAGEPGQALAWTSDASYVLPDQAAELLGADHPYLSQATGGLIDICHHPDAGQFVLSGWHREGKPLSFPNENGAHAGPGTEETRAFVLMPNDVPHGRTEGCFRPTDLRAAALYHLGRGPLPERVRRVARHASHDALRVVTYNVHQCLGRDGKYSPARIARIIARCEPDVVALQELDAAGSRANQLEIVGEISRLLQTEFHTCPSTVATDDAAGEHAFFGNAILSRHPLRLIRAAALPRATSKRRPLAGPHGASWVTLDIAGREIQVFNTNLSRKRRERRTQIETLLGPDWMAHPDCDGPLIVCGDFKPLRKSRTKKLLGHELVNAQKKRGIHRPRRTWTGRSPLSTSERIYVSGPLQVLKSSVSRNELSRLASDHFPLVVEVRVL